MSQTQESLQIEQIVDGVIHTLMAPCNADTIAKSTNTKSEFPDYSTDEHLCPYSEDSAVRTAIHSLVRMELCRVHPDGVFSPCYPSKGARECRNVPCAHVIGHSIYIWVHSKLQNIHRGEVGGFGCTFKHKTEDLHSLRTKVLDYLDYRFKGYIESSATYSRATPDINHFLAVVAVNKVAWYVKNVIFTAIARGNAITELVPAYNVTNRRPESVELFKTSDQIFARFEVEVQLEEMIDDDEEVEHYQPPSLPSYQDHQAMNAQRYNSDESVPQQLRDPARFPPLGTGIVSPLRQLIVEDLDAKRFIVSGMRPTAFRPVVSNSGSAIPPPLILSADASSLPPLLPLPPIVQITSANVSLFPTIGESYTESEIREMTSRAKRRPRTGD